MPIHDWSRVPAGLFHHFHQQWSSRLCDALNAGRLPKGHSALIEAIGRDAFVQAAEEDAFGPRPNRVALHHPLGKVITVIEIVSPGNKSSQQALRAFVERALRGLQQGIHLLIIDILPPTPRDPQGIHKVIWDEVQKVPFELPVAKPLTLAAYTAGRPITAYVEPVAQGGPLPEMAVFLDPETYILAPLEATYLAAWEACPADYREAIEALGP
jgi:hypothetical protein